MNRRSFFTKLGLAAASMAILPAATMYTRHWVKPAEGLLFQNVNDTLTSLNLIPNPAWETAPYQVAWVCHGVSEYGYCTTKVGETFPKYYKILNEPERFAPDMERGMLLRVPRMIPSPMLNPNPNLKPFTAILV